MLRKGNFMTCLHFFPLFVHLIRHDSVPQTLNYERTEVGGQNALNAPPMNARGSYSQENY